ncbi:hypothetical protein EVAR_9134_1 [Eumeta japonica]|uniref:Uncharacterized protein n=1 Tax=Eumeta variegata TaxID=151549 RepID=A0A4C1TWC9_EUMVA|nr:hypothetical protein EVAR_9134_1 [Eumeta japonica]
MFDIGYVRCVGSRPHGYLYHRCACPSPAPLRCQASKEKALPRRVEPVSPGARAGGSSGHIAVGGHSRSLHRTPLDNVQDNVIYYIHPRRKGGGVCVHPELFVYAATCTRGVQRRIIITPVPLPNSKSVSCGRRFASCVVHDLGVLSCMFYNIYPFKNSDQHG